MSTATLPDVGSFVKSLATAKPKSGSGKSPSLALPEIAGRTDAWKAAKRERDRWQSVMDTEESQIFAVGIPALLAHCRRTGKVESCLHFNGLSIIRTSRYCAVPDEYVERCRAAFNGSGERYFPERLTISLTESAAADESFLGDLVNGLGESGFAERFTVKRACFPSDDFHRDYTLRAEVEQAAAELVNMEAIKPYKPSLRAA